MGPVRRGRSFVTSSVLVLLSSLGVAAPPADAPVAVGSLQVSTAELATRIAGLSPLERRSLGASPAAVNLAYVKQVVVPELLFLAEAARLGLEKDPAVERRIRHALFEALAAAERASLPSASEEEIARYYDAHRRDFERPERIALWRILVRTEAEARAVVEKVRGAGGPERWRAEAREKSLDEATKQRGGDLGFVHPDGSTDVPELRVPKALFEAARGVADGELVPEPVQEGEHFAVVWRRGTLSPLRVPLEVARPTIEARLVEQKLGERLDALVRRLTAEHVKNRRDDLLQKVDLTRLASTP